MNIEALRFSVQRIARFEFSRSGGPGGQNVNKVNTKVLVRVALDSIDGISATELKFIKERLVHRMVENDIVVVCDEERSQDANRRQALARIEDLLVIAGKIPKRRIKTRATFSSIETRIKTKKAHGIIKKNRGKIEE